MTLAPMRGACSLHSGMIEIDDWDGMNQRYYYSLEKLRESKEVKQTL